MAPPWTGKHCDVHDALGAGTTGLKTYIVRSAGGAHNQVRDGSAFGADDGMRGVQSDWQSMGRVDVCSGGRGRALRFGWTQAIRKVSGYAKETMEETIRDSGISGGLCTAASACGRSVCIRSSGEYSG